MPLLIGPVAAKGEPQSVFLAAKGPIEPWLKEEVQLIDARDRDRWLRARLPRSIYIDWEQMSGLGLGSRGSLPKRPEHLLEELASAGLTAKRPTLVLGRGLNGFGDEWRVAWMLRWLGFRQVGVLPYETYLEQAKAAAKGSLSEEKGPYKPKPAPRPGRAQLWSKELITAQELDRLRTKGLLPLVLDVRDQKGAPPLPRPLSEHKIWRLHWREVIEPDGKLKLSLVGHPVIQQLKAELALRKGPAAQVVVVSFAGLSSAVVTMALRELSVEAVNLSEGLSWYL